jgi:hypothetical protein
MAVNNRIFIIVICCPSLDNLYERFERNILQKGKHRKAFAIRCYNPFTIRIQSYKKQFSWQVQ